MPRSARQPTARRSISRPPGRPPRAAASHPPPAAAEPAGETSDIADQRRRDLLEAAYATVAEKGLEGLRTRDIAARAGVNISTLHYYFGTKEQLLVALIKHVHERFAPSGGEHGDAAGDSPWPSDGAIGVFDHIAGAWQTFQKHPALPQVLQELSARSARDPDAQATFRTIFAGWNDGLAKGMRAAIDAGQLDRSVDPHAAAAIITSFIMGAMVQLGVNGKAFDFLAVGRELERWANSSSSAASPAAGSARRAARPRRR